MKDDKKKVQLKYRACECGRDKETWQPRCDTCREEIQREQRESRFNRGAKGFY